MGLRPGKGPKTTTKGVVRSALVTFQRWNRVKMTLLQFPLLTINLDEAFQELLQVFDRSSGSIPN